MSNTPSLAALDPLGSTLAPGSPGTQPYIQWIDDHGGKNNLFFDCVVSEDWPDEGTTVTEHPVEVGADIADHVRVKLPTYTLTVRATNEPFKNAGPNQVQPTKGPQRLQVGFVHLVPASQTLTFQKWKNEILARALASAAGGAIGTAVGGTTGGVIGSVVGGVAASLLFPPEAVTESAAAQGLTFSSGQGAVTIEVAQYPGVDYVQATHGLLVELKNQAVVFGIFGSKQSEPNMVIESLSFHRDAQTGTGEDLVIGFKQVRVVSTQTITLPVPHVSAPAPKPMGQQALVPDDLSMNEAAQLFASLGWIPSPPTPAGNSALPTPQ